MFVLEGYLEAVEGLLELVDFYAEGLHTLDLFGFLELQPGVLEFVAVEVLDEAHVLYAQLAVHAVDLVDLVLEF